MKVIGGFLETTGWCIYLGGILTMEFVWRPAQLDLAPAQTGILCLQMGKRYKWLALAGLGVIALGGRFLYSANWQLYIIAIGWLVLVGLVILMGSLVHPRSHAKSLASADEKDYRELRSKRLALIALMNKMLRFELFIALFVALVGVYYRA